MTSPDVTRLHGHRKRLPNRRISRTIEVNWPVGSDRHYTISIGFDERGTVRELFADWQKAGSDLESIIDDACVGYSLALQFGANIADLAQALGREGSSHWSPEQIAGQTQFWADRNDRHGPSMSAFDAVDGSHRRHPGAIEWLLLTTLKEGAVLWVKLSQSELIWRRASFRSTVLIPLARP